MGSEYGLTIAGSEHGSLVSNTWTANPGAVRVEETDGIEGRDESGCICQEVSTVCEEDHHGKRVAEKELSESSEHEEHATEPDVDCGGCD